MAERSHEMPTQQRFGDRHVQIRIHRHHRQAQCGEIDPLEQDRRRADRHHDAQTPDDAEPDHGNQESREPQPGQLIFLDTPGIHRASTPLNRAMVDAATGTFGNVDLLLLLAEAGPAPHPDDRFIIESLRDDASPGLSRHQQDRPWGKAASAAPHRRVSGSVPLPGDPPPLRPERRWRGRPHRGDLEHSSPKGPGISPKR